MILNKLDNLFGFHEEALKLRSKRQEIIAANIANADTPHFKARDIDFKQSMLESMQQQADPRMKGFADQQQQLNMAGSLKKTSANHLSGTPATQANPFNSLNKEALYRPIRQGSVDGNTVDMDVERNQFADNAIRYEASILKLNGLIKSMMTAIQGQ